MLPVADRRLWHSMVYMSRMPQGEKQGQSRLAKRSGEGPKRSPHTDGSNDAGQGLEVEGESCGTCPPGATAANNQEI